MSLLLRSTGVLGIVAIVLLLASPALAAPGTTAAHPPAKAGPASWSTYLGGVARESRDNDEPAIGPHTVGLLHEIWNISAGGAVVAEPIVVGNRVYFGSWNGNELAANTSTGAVLWKTFLGITYCGLGSGHFGVSSTPTLLNNRLYLGGGADDWYALNATSGAIRWSVYTGNNSPGVAGGGHYDWSSPLVNKGFAYIGIASACDTPLVVGSLWKVNLTSHRVVQWFNTTNSSELGATIWSSPTLDPAAGIIYVTTGNFYNNTANMSLYDDSLIALRAGSLAVVGHWHVPAQYEVGDGDFGATPTLWTTATGAFRVGAINKDGYFWAFDRSNISTPVWDLKLTTGTPVAPAAFGFGSLFVGTGNARINGTHSPNGSVSGGVMVNGTVWSLNATTGLPNWVVPMPGGVLGAPVLAGGLVFAAGGDRLVALSARTGAVLWSWTASKAFYGAPTVNDGVLYIGNNDGHLYAFGLGTTGTSGNGTGGAGSLPHGLPGAPFVWVGPGTALMAVPTARPRRG
jgi:outer membrane protein assembly factor BamB